MYQALYRKWRPKTFDDVVGQEHITATLKNEVATGKFSHAYLFTGSRGTGKTTCSKIVAKAVNCERPVDGNPCNECAACRGIDDGSVLDVVEIDAASNNGVDNIRQLREEAYFLPSVVKYRVYILDECHMLSQGAVNALLKILEEPPEHVVFILATTEIHKVLPTILSRCQRFDFHRIRSRVIDKHLFEYAKQELVKIASQGEPFAFTMLTADTHHVGGYVCDLCQNQYAEQYENVYACSSRQIYEFVQWIQQQEFYENTTIVLVGDHCSMDADYIARNVSEDYVRRVYNCIINPAVEPKNAKNREFTTMDMFPTTLAAMGATIRGERLGLGTNLFSDVPTMAERMGVEEWENELGKRSVYYIKHFTVEEGK